MSAHQNLTSRIGGANVVMFLTFVMLAAPPIAIKLWALGRSEKNLVYFIKTCIQHYSIKTKKVFSFKTCRLVQKKRIKKLNIQGDMSSPKFIENILGNKTFLVFILLCFMQVFIK